MTIDIRPVPGALFALLLTVASALAGPAIVHTDTIVRELPKEESSHLFDLIAGTHVEVIGCNAKQWCKVDRNGQIGWIHEAELDLTPAKPGAANLVVGSSGGQPGSLSTSGDGPIPGTGPGNPETGISAIDGGCCAVTVTDD